MQQFHATVHFSVVFKMQADNKVNKIWQKLWVMCIRELMAVHTASIYCNTFTFLQINIFKKKRNKLLMASTQNVTPTHENKLKQKQ